MSERSEPSRLTVWALLFTAACAGGRGSEGREPAALPSPAMSAAAVEETLRPGLVARNLAPDAWVVTHFEAHSSNVLVVRLTDGTIVLASSPYDSATTRVLLDWVHTRWSPKRIVAINTHWHGDGTAGNAVYREAGVETYASTHTQALALERGPQMRKDAAEGLPPALAEQVRATPVVPAAHTFEAATGLTLTFGGEPVQVSFPGPSHSEDHVVVFLPTRGILFGGCMLKNGNSLGYMGDASVDTWGEALDRLEVLDAAIVVPGHGRSGGPELIANTQRLVREALAAGTGP